MTFKFPPPLRSHLLATAALTAGLVAAPLVPTLTDDGGATLSKNTAAAQQKQVRGQGGGQGGPAARGGQGGSDIMNIIEDRIFRGKGRKVIIILEEDGDEDSDRPEWAMGNRDVNPHIRGGGQPAGAGTKKGDLYGDLWIILRDENGEPVLDANGNVQPILTDGTVIQLTEEGDLPPDVDEEMLQEVEFSRLSVVRAASQVYDHALEEALDKLASATTITLDEAGRLVADGTAIDSPLENISLYTFIMTGGTIPNLPADFDVATLLGAASDKTGEVNVDMVVYLNTIEGINVVDPVSGTLVYYDFSTYDYDRLATYDIEVSYYKNIDADPELEVVTESLITAVFGGDDWTDSTAGGADDFAQAADDARAVIEFLHENPLVPATE